MRDLQPINVEAYLSRTALFSGLSAEELKRISAGSRLEQYARGDTLFHQGEPCGGMHILIYGQVKLLLVSSQGNEKVVDVIQQGQSFGEALMFMEKPYVVSAAAVDDSLLLHVSRQVIFDELARDTQLCAKMLRGLAAREYQLLRDVEAYSLMTGVQRIVGYLLHEIPDDQQKARQVEIDLNTAKGIIASRLNLTQEHFSRLLGELARAGVITVDGRHIIIPDVARLRAYAS